MIGSYSPGYTFCVPRMNMSLRAAEQGQPVAVDPGEVTGAHLGERMLAAGRRDSRAPVRARSAPARRRRCAPSTLGTSAADVVAGAGVRELLGAVGDRDRQDLGHSVDRADRACGKRARIARRAAGAAPGAPPMTIVSRRGGVQLGTRVQRVQHRVEGGRHGEQHLGVGQVARGTARARAPGLAPAGGMVQCAPAMRAGMPTMS